MISTRRFKRTIKNSQQVTFALGYFMRKKADLIRQSCEILPQYTLQTFKHSWISILRIVLTGLCKNKIRQAREMLPRYTLQLSSPNESSVFLPRWKESIDNKTELKTIGAKFYVQCKKVNWSSIASINLNLMRTYTEQSTMNLDFGLQ